MGAPEARFPAQQAPSPLPPNQTFFDHTNGAQALADFATFQTLYFNAHADHFITNAESIAVAQAQAQVYANVSNHTITLVAEVGGAGQLGWAFEGLF